jgi:putative photosynthetic complex assembly protein
MSGLQSQMRRRDVEMVPLVLVRAMFGSMLAALALVSFAVLTDRPLVGVPAPSPVASEITVRLAGERNGDVAVIGPDGMVIARSDEDMNGFIGVLWRNLKRERMSHGLPDEAPVRVVRRASGRVAVIDDSTGMTVELIGYGKDNIAAFAKLVP